MKTLAKSFVSAEDIKALAANLGSDLCGIASIDRFDDSPVGFHPTDVLPGTNSVVSLACRIPDTALFIDSPVPYTAIDDLVMAKVGQIALSLNLYLEDKGYRAVIIPSVPYDYWEPDTLTGKGILSLKHLAQKAGLGTIGKNSLLCTPQYGNLVKLGAVITDAVLTPDDLLNENICSASCSLCIRNCPVGAIGLDGRIDQKKCREHAEVQNKRGVDIYACCECRKVCPNRTGISVHTFKRSSYLYGKEML